MNRTLARVKFKTQLGQANHYLVTNLVALRCLSSSPLYEAPEELHTTWNPQSRLASIERSRIFVQHSFLGWAVDALDMYISLLNRKPDYLQSDELSASLSSAGHSIRAKVEAIESFYKVNPVTQALIDVLITWRNNVFHTLAETEVSVDSERAIEADKEYIEANYRGLDASQLPAKANKADMLTFKETASLINAVHQFVQDVDAEIIDKLDVSTFCSGLVFDQLRNRGRNPFASKYYGLTLERRKEFVTNWLANNYCVDSISDDEIETSLSFEREAGQRGQVL